MDDIEFSFDDESESPDERLALELAREDQSLVVRLIELRKQRGISQEELADRLGIAQATISGFERLGNDPRMSTVRRYARALGVMVRHHVDLDPLCADSQYIAHVTPRGVTTQETAAAIRRSLRETPHLDLNDWTEAQPQQIGTPARTLL